MAITDNKKNTSSSDSSKSEKQSDSTSTDSNSSDSKPSTEGAYARGERQKIVTDSYRNSWDRIFTKKKGR